MATITAETMSAGDAAADLPAIKTLSIADLKDAITRGIADFGDRPTHLVVLAPLYPLLTLCAFLLTFNRHLLPLVFPVLSGLVLVGPFATIGLYEFSRRREKGLDISWTHAFDFWHSPALGSVLFLGMVLVGLFFGWLVSAYVIYLATVGTYEPQGLAEFLRLVFTTAAGWTMIVVGNLAGLVFAIAAMSISVVSFPMLLDRNVSLARAVQTSVRVVAKNPVTMAAWGLIVAGALFAGALPLLVGLAVVIPVLAHATWHIYRKAVA